MNCLPPLRRLKIFLNLFVLEKSLLLHELLAPPSKSDPIVGLVLLEKLF